PDNLVYALYTSGSTGRPKGVMVRHRGVVNRLLWAQEEYPVTASDRVLHKASFSFDFSVWELFGPLLCGARVVLAHPGGHRDPSYLAQALAEHGITLLHFVPSMLQAFLGQVELPAFPSLRYVFAGGETLTPELRDLALTRLGKVLRNQYGPTEISIDVTECPCRPGDRRRPVPIGRPIANASTWVVGPSWELQPVGVAGELLLGGEGVARGYQGRPELTAERFVPDPFTGVAGARLYRSGDLARWLPEGDLEFLGRIDQQVKVRGFRIEPGEIEAALLEHAGVREAAVVARDDGGDRRLVANVVPAAEPAPAWSELRDSLRSRLPEHMVPSALVILGSLPLTPSGKLDRRSLPVPDWGGSGAVFTPPRTPVEELVAGAFARVLGVERAGAEDDFFALGGHSLLATRLVSQVREVLGVEIALRSVFEEPTVAGLAARVERARWEGSALLAPPIVPVPRDGGLPLSFAQQRLWFLDQLEPDRGAYNMPFAQRLVGELKPEVLARCLGEILRRHEVLRTRFMAVGGGPVQVIAPWTETRLPVVDLSVLEEAAREPLARALALEEARRPFDLERDPMLRMSLLRLGEADHVVLATMHHIASDGWSTGVLLRELGALYEAFAAGRPSPLPELPIQYADYAVWQQRRLRGEALAAELSFWRRQLAGVPPLLELPTDRPRPAVQTFRGGFVPLVLPEAVAQGLAVLGRREGVTPFMLLLSAFAVLLSRHCGQDDLSVGSPVAGRGHLETEGLIGFFVNMLVLRTDLSGAPSFREVLERVREVCLEAYVHQELPFEKLVEELQPARSLSHHPLFQAVLALESTPAPLAELPELSALPLDVRASTAKFDLTLWLRGSGGNLCGGL